MYRGIIAFLLFFSFNNFVHAQTQIDKSNENQTKLEACQGNNLLTTLSPTDKTKLKKQTESVPNGKGIFWKIEKDGIAPSWLLGTFHATDERVLDLPQTITQPLKNADRVVLELAETQDKNEATLAFTTLMAKNPNLMNYPNGKTFEGEMPKQFEDEINAVLKYQGLTAERLFSMKPWVVFITMAYPKCEGRRIQAGYKVLDEEIAQIAKQNLIPVRGLETVEEQTLSLATMPDEVQYELIAKSAKSDQADRDLFETTIDLYLAEDIGTLLKLNGVFKEYEVSKKSEDIFTDALLTKRNHRMAERMTPMIELGNSFFAVGAAHLGDEEGVVELLRKKGFTVTRVSHTQ